MARAREGFSAAQAQVIWVLRDGRDWQAAVYFWAGCALAAAVVIAPLWRFTATGAASASPPPAAR
jgi:hypothetical protein